MTFAAGTVFVDSLIDNEEKVLLIYSKKQTQLETGVPKPYVTQDQNVQN